MVATFYTGTNRYIGWCNLIYKSKYLELCSWLQSGNYLMVQNKKISTIKQLKEIFKTADQTVIEEIKA
jgi:hypothetical protein